MTSHILLNVTNPKNKLKVVLYSDFGLKCLFAIHKALSANIFEVEVISMLYPHFKDIVILQALLTGLGVVWSNEVITQLNDSIKGYASVRGNAYVAQHRAIGEHFAIGEHIAVEGNNVIGVNESDENVLLFDYSNKRLSNNDDVDMDFMQAGVDGATDGSEDSERAKGSHLDTDSYDNLFNVDKEVKKRD